MTVKEFMKQAVFGLVLLAVWVLPPFLLPFRLPDLVFVAWLFGVPILALWFFDTFDIKLRRRPGK
jgi:hypothetical protein